ncbi:hypothetical protein AVEN_254138-1 [Araneus ventricosus]|uniref:Uncharacterized protein n=1 Tax=Araneus ventricosus TaxID=182803 RepID=A0A4Y2BY72_ARAVE|nr:hypothetical protein AVEN_254138-1 [Araneus ventricosus]
MFSLSLVILATVLKQRESYFGTALISLNLSQMTRTPPGLAPPLQTSAPHQREDVWPPTYDLTCNRPNTRRIFSGIGNLRPQSRDLITRPPWPHKLEVPEYSLVWEKVGIQTCPG